MNLKITRTIAFAGAIALFSGVANAEDHMVKAQGVKFDPQVIFVQPGDTITWTSMPTHDTASVEGMIPDGAEGWQSKMGENFTITVEKEGAYVYKCTPHVSVGMLGAIVVGDGEPPNLSAIESSPENKGMIKAKGVKPLVKALAAR